MCGGRLVICPCSRAGHMFRKSKELKAKQWPPSVPSRLVDKLNFGLSVPGIRESWYRMDNFSKVFHRNNIRVLNIWVGNHPAKYAYYKENLEDEHLGPEWQQYVDELETDPAALRQKGLKDRNGCRDFYWWDRHVYMRLAGTHHPWSKARNLHSAETVNCGGHRAESCSKCPNGNGKEWCDGECRWCGPKAQCVSRVNHSQWCYEAFGERV